MISRCQTCGGALSTGGCANCSRVRYTPPVVRTVPAIRTMPADTTELSIETLAKEVAALRRRVALLEDRLGGVR